jgi:hypothetical protein
MIENFRVYVIKKESGLSYGNGEEHGGRQVPPLVAVDARQEARPIRHGQKVVPRALKQTQKRH